MEGISASGDPVNWNLLARANPRPEANYISISRYTYIHMCNLYNLHTVPPTLSIYTDIVSTSIQTHIIYIYIYIYNII